MTQPAEQITSEQACRKYRDAESLGRTGLDIKRLRELGWECGPIEPQEPYDPPRYQDFKRYVLPSCAALGLLVVLTYFAPEIAGRLS